MRSCLPLHCGCQFFCPSCLGDVFQCCIQQKCDRSCCLCLDADQHWSFQSSPPVCVSWGLFAIQSFLLLWNQLKWPLCDSWFHVLQSSFFFFLPLHLKVCWYPQSKLCFFDLLIHLYMLSNLPFPFLLASGVSLLLGKVGLVWAHLIFVVSPCEHPTRECRILSCRCWCLSTFVIFLKIGSLRFWSLVSPQAYIEGLLDPCVCITGQW